MTAMRRREPIEVAIVERRRLVRTALRALLETGPGVRVVAVAACWNDAVTRSDVVLLGVGAEGELDAVLGDASGAARPRVIVLSDDPPEGLAPRAAAGGASGFVCTSEPPKVIFKAIERVHGGEVWFDGATMAVLIASVAGIRPPAPDTSEPIEAAVAALVGRDREIAAAVAEGLTNREIALQIGLSEPAVRHALTRIYRAVGVRGRVELARLGLKLGLSAGLPR